MMANEQNLVPFKKGASSEEAKKNGSKGGKASGEARRKRKAMKEQLEMLLKLPVTKEDVIQNIEELGIETGEIDYQMAMTVALFYKAVKGDTRAYEIIRDTIGENPTNKIVPDSDKPVEGTLRVENDTKNRRIGQDSV